MNRTFIAVIFLFLVIVTAVTSSAYLNRQTDELLTLAEKAFRNEALAPELVTKWEEKQVAFAVFLGHDHFESLNGSVKVLPYLKQEDYREACAEAIVKLEELKSHISFSFKNLF
ncbi:MAG TPA: hypothetical protein DDY98_01710 [Ruminococcaceae bacterium]|nr:hypothetical protein [Oscillospiraceae bacterium]